MRIFIIRHGESVGNLYKICLGHTDLGLTDRGREQAFATAKALEHLHFYRIYSSDLCRAVETAHPNAFLRGIADGDIVRLSSLRELYFGDWENAAVDDLKSRYGDMFTIGWRQNFGTFTPPNGESVPDLADRMCNALSDIARECFFQITSEGSRLIDNNGSASREDVFSSTPDVNILVVSHAASIRAFWGKISGYNPEDVCDAVPFPSNASYSIVDYDVGRDVFTPVAYSVDGHLAELKTALPG